MLQAIHRSISGLLILALLLSACGPLQRVPYPKVLVLGIDGLDPVLLRRFIDQGRLPNFQALVRDGHFKPLRTVMPPLSPVAWSAFITGMDAGGHAIFDFVHRDPKTLLPEFSMSKAIPSDRSLTIGSWVIPLSGGRVELLREGKPFWQLLQEKGVPTTVFRMPVNFPPQGQGRALSGMGTPDLLGTPGTFSYYTSSSVEDTRDVGGGRISKVQVYGNRVEAKLRGPGNPYRMVSQPGGGHRNPELDLTFQVFLDPLEPVGKFVVQDQEFILKEREWSEWIRLEFEAVPYLASISATARFYLQRVHPEFRLYVTPLQINPREPVMPISQPEGWSAELADELGYFYTQELAEDTKALSSGVFDASEFWVQSQSVFAEQKRAFEHLLETFDEGFLFYYFSGVDQISHMLWRYMDPKHPGHKIDSDLGDGIRTMYEKMDGVVAQILEKLDQDTTLIILSDHGFAPFYRQVNLNSWLHERGYVKFIRSKPRGPQPFFQNVDWKGTTTYALGLNGVYVNLEGREGQGVVAEGADYADLLERLEDDLLAMTDPATGLHPISRVVRSQRDFKGPFLDRGPDLIIGYSRGYRSSWESPLGDFPPDLFLDNTDPWSGDHSIDSRLVPGVLISNREIIVEEPSLVDLTVAVLDEYGVEKLPEMIGQDCLGSVE